MSHKIRLDRKRPLRYRISDYVALGERLRLSHEGIARQLNAPPEEWPADLLAVMLWAGCRSDADAPELAEVEVIVTGWGPREKKRAARAVVRALKLLDADTSKAQRQVNKVLTRLNDIGARLDILAGKRPGPRLAVVRGKARK